MSESFMSILTSCATLVIVAGVIIIFLVIAGAAVLMLTPMLSG
jgi:hypothetical protein